LERAGTILLIGGTFQTLYWKEMEGEMKKSIEDTAREYAESNYHPLLEHLDYIKFCDITDSFIAGYARAIEESAEGFEVKTAENTWSKITRCLMMTFVLYTTNY